MSGPRTVQATTKNDYSECGEVKVASVSTIKIVQALTHIKKIATGINKAFEVKKAAKSGSPAESKRNSKIWIAKYSSNELVANCELIGQEGMRFLSLMPQPKTRYWINGERLGIISEKMYFNPLSDTGPVTSNFLFGLGQSTLLSIFFHETDLKLEHLDSERATKIDGDWMLSGLTSSTFKAGSEITEAELASLPYLKDYHANQWLDQIVRGKKQKLGQNSIFNNVSKNPQFRQGVNLAILSVILLSNELIHNFVNFYASNGSFIMQIATYLIARKNQLFYAALENDSFKEFISKQDNQKKVMSYVERARDFVTIGKQKLVSEKAYPRVKREMMDFFSEVRSAANTTLKASVSDGELYKRNNSKRDAGNKSSRRKSN